MAVDRYAAPPAAAWWSAAGAAIAGWCAWSMWVGKATTRRAAGSILLALGCAASGGIRHHGAWYEFAADDVGTYATTVPRPVRLEGVVVDSPRDTAPPNSGPAAGGGAGGDAFSRAAAPERMFGSGPRTRFTLDATQIRDGAELRPVDGRVDVEVGGLWPAGRAGDRVELVGRLAARSPPMNPGEFDFAAHFRADRKLCALRVDSAEQVTIVGRRPWWDIAAMISDLRRAAHDRLLKSLPADQVGFASALLLGYRDQLDAADNRAFFRTGMVHILSISGMHVAMLALFLQCGLRVGWVGRRTAAAVIIGVTAGYGLLIDAEPPAVRAVIVIAAVGLATIVGRRSRAFNVLAGSALVVLAMNPNDLFRTGPQLSFLAAAVLAWWAERRPEPESTEQGAEGPATTDPQATPDFIEQLERRSLRRRAARRLAVFGRGLLVSAAILAITTPLVAHRFHVASPISLVLTPILAIPVALGLLFGLLTLVAWVVLPPVAPLFGAVCGYCLRFTEATVVYAQDWPGATFWLPGPSLAGVIAFYELAVLWTWWPAGVRGRRWAAAAVVGWGIYSHVPQHEFPTDCRLRCTFIAVDHGLSVLVEDARASGPQAWLYDCGGLGSGVSAARSIAGVLWSRGITRLEGIVISHADADHYNGLPTLLEQFDVGQLIVSESMHDSREPAAELVRQAAGSAGVPMGRRSTGESLPWNSRTVMGSIVLPPAAGVEGSDNARSVVIEIVAADRRVLLTGDLEGAGLKALLAGPPRDCDILLAPHHGSASSNPEGLAQWCRPELVVVSGSAGGKSSTRTAYEAAGARVLETTVDGAITFTIDGAGRIDVATFVEK